MKTAISARGPLPKDQKILKRVDKLFCLAGSPNEHEASLALQRANQMLKKHNLRHSGRRDRDEYTYVIINQQRKRIEHHQRVICSLLMDYYFVEVVFSSLYDARTHATYKAIELLGTPENVRIAEHVYYFLVNRLALLWKAHRRATSCPAGFRLCG